MSASVYAVRPCVVDIVVAEMSKLSEKHCLHVRLTMKFVSQHGYIPEVVHVTYMIIVWVINYRGLESSPAVSCW